MNATGMIRVRRAEGSTCIGDSGGPLIDPRTRRIVAVVSAGVIDDRGVTCGTNSGARYTPVDRYRDFVDEAIAAGEKAEAEEESGGCNATSSRTTRSDLLLASGITGLAFVRLRRRNRRA